MRITRLLFRQYKHSGPARLPQNIKKVPFQPILPLELRDRVSGKVDSQKSTVACLHEMSVVFAALKDHEFNDKNCAREFENLKKAHVDSMNAAREEKLKNAGQLNTIGNQLTSKQLNRYLKKFPAK